MTKKGIYYELYDDGSVARKDKVMIKTDGSGYEVSGGETWFGGSDSSDLRRFKDRNQLVYDDDDYEIEWYKDYRFQVVDRTGFIFHQSGDKVECEKWIADHGDWSHEGSFQITHRETWCGRRIHKKGDCQLRLF